MISFINLNKGELTKTLYLVVRKKNSKNLQGIPGTKSRQSLIYIG